MILLAHAPAVVASEDDNGVVLEPGIVERVEDFADKVVHRCHTCEIGLDELLQGQLAMAVKGLQEALIHFITSVAVGDTVTVRIKSINFEKLIQRAPERVIESAVKGMLPKNPLGRAMYRKMKVYKGTAHPHAAQQPQELKI